MLNYNFDLSTTLRSYKAKTTSEASFLISVRTSADYNKDAVFDELYDCVVASEWLVTETLYMMADGSHRRTVKIVAGSVASPYFSEYASDGFYAEELGERKTPATNEEEEEPVELISNALIQFAGLFFVYCEVHDGGDINMYGPFVTIDQAKSALDACLVA